ncbi:hypothetical protein SKAU_G00298510 [Synaphobranchus kaupii]|uniref:Uncharacterized protein n=1 Tax=Synaphobranchus kaupii TaxID=118154 RepID=A0A9Q1IN13_SYNKA|nr:hypothetical protein SKAU_G00298510 [Synaphobranchus kaupii]
MRAVLSSLSFPGAPARSPPGTPGTPGLQEHGNPPVTRASQPRAVPALHPAAAVERTRADETALETWRRWLSSSAEADSCPDRWECRSSERNAELIPSAPLSLSHVEYRGWYWTVNSTGASPPFLKPTFPFLRFGQSLEVPCRRPPVATGNHGGYARRGPQG